MVKVHMPFPVSSICISTDALVQTSVTDPAKPWKKSVAYEASVGVTTIAPATMTLPTTELEQILANAAEYQKNPAPGADLVGINMEGPFISPAKKGAPG